MLLFFDLTAEIEHLNGRSTLTLEPPWHLGLVRRCRHKVRRDVSLWNEPGAQPASADEQNQFQENRSHVLICVKGSASEARYRAALFRSESRLQLWEK